MGPDHAGRFLHEIQTWQNERLEDVHDYIQWLFPLLEPSPVNPQAPTLDADVIRLFHERTDLRDHLRASLVRMLEFYGLRLVTEPPLKVERGPSFAERSSHWITPGNHNHLRITRILKSLTLLGLAGEAGAFLECLGGIYEERRPAISARSFQFWREAVGQGITRPARL